MAYEAGGVMIARGLAAEWATCFTTALLDASDLKSQVCAVEVVELPPSLIAWEMEFSILPGEAIIVGASSNDIDRMIEAMRTTLGLEHGVSRDRRLYSGLVRHSQSLLAAVIGGQVSSNITAAGAKLCEESRLSYQHAFTLHYLEETITFFVAVPPAWDQLWNAKEPVKKQSPARTAGSQTLPVLLDVDVAVAISFGRTTMRVSDALKLVTGALVELESRPDDRVELKINRRVIARGDVVIVDGNYGVRITDIVSPMQRLDTGHQVPVEEEIPSAEMMGQP